MSLRLSAVAVSLVAVVWFAGCSRLPGKPAPGPEVPRPDSVLDPVALYQQNCAGCHGADGRNGPAMMVFTRTVGAYSWASASVTTPSPLFAAA